MAANIKIGANSSEFQRQMREMSMELKKVSSSYNLANTQAKLFGNTTDILKSRQSELTSKINIQNNMIKAQSKYISNLNKDIDKQKNEQSNLSNKIDETTKKYKESVKETGKNSAESKKLRKELGNLKEEYAKNSREIDTNIKKLDNADIKLNNSKTKLIENEKALKDVNKELEKLKIDKLTKGFDKLGGALVNTGSNLTYGLSLPLVGVGTASFNLASDLNENLNKTEVVFKENADTVKKWSETSLDKMGMCQSSALDMASKFGDMGSSMGLSSNDTLNYSKSLTQLSADLASFKNISIDRANEALTGVYTGETEALKSLGIVMTETNLAEFAHQQGIKKKVSDMTQAEKVQLRYNYVMSKTKDAQGDFARTNDQAANAGRTFTESVKELGSTFGNDLLPIFTPLINKANDFIKKLAGMDGSTRKSILAISGIAVVAGPTLLVIGNLVKGIGSFSRAMLSLPKNIKNGVKSLKDTSKSMKNFIKDTKSGTNILGKFTKKFSSTSKSIINFNKNLGKKCITSIKNFNKGIMNAGKQVAKFSVSLGNKAVKGLISFGKSTLNVTKSLGKLSLSILKNTTTLAKTGLTWAINKGKLLAYKTVQLTVTAATKTMTLAQKALNLALKMNPIGLVITALVALGAIFVTLYNKCEWFRNGVNAVWNGVKNIFIGFANFFKGAFKTDFTQTFGLLGVPLNTFFGIVGSIFNGVKGVFNGLMTFLSGVFTGNWRSIFKGLSDIVKSIFGAIGGIIKAPINAAIRGINSAIRAVNRISFTVPNWVPGIGGSHFGVNLPTIPALAEGGIVTKATMALVGEGKEHEAVIPLSKLDRLVTSSVEKVLNNNKSKTDSKQIFIVKNILDSKEIGIQTYELVNNRLALSSKRRRF